MTLKCNSPNESENKTDWFGVFLFCVENGEENLTKKNGLQNMKSGKDLDIQIESLCRLKRTKVQVVRLILERRSKR